MQFQSRGKSLKTRVNHFIHAPFGRALSQSDCTISGVNQLYSFGVIECSIYVQYFILLFSSYFLPIISYYFLPSCSHNIFPSEIMMSLLMFKSTPSTRNIYWSPLALST